MAAQRGRDILLKIDDGAGGFTTVAGLRSRTISLNARTVDSSDSESPDQWRELLAGTGVKSVSISGTGIFRDEESDEAIRASFFAQSVQNWQIVIPGFAQLTGPFVVAALEYSGRHDGEAQSAMTLASAGAINAVAI